jgi:hypothetical protein
MSRRSIRRLRGIALPLLRSLPNYQCSREDMSTLTIFISQAVSNSGEHATQSQRAL